MKTVDEGMSRPPVRKAVGCGTKSRMDQHLTRKVILSVKYANCYDLQKPVNIFIPKVEENFVAEKRK